MITFVGRFRIFAVVVRDEKLRCRAEAAVVARVNFVVAQVENVAVSTVPIVEIGTILEPVRIETSVFLVQTANRVRAGQKAKRTRRHQTVIFCDMARLGPAAGRRARAGRADFCHAGDGSAVAQRVKRGHAVVIHVPPAAVFNFRHGVIADVPILRLEPHRAPDRAVDARDGAAHRVAVIVELPDRVGERQAMQYHRRGLPARDVVPVKDRPAFFLGSRPFGGDAADHARQVGVVRRGVGDDLEIVNGGERN